MACALLEEGGGSVTRTLPGKRRVCVLAECGAVHALTLPGDLLQCQAF